MSATVGTDGTLYIMGGYAQNYTPMSEVDALDPPAPVTPTIVTSDSGGVYNGAPYAATVTINDGPSLDGVTPVSYYENVDPNSNNGYDYIGTNAPTNVGSYVTFAEFDGSQNWDPGTSNVVHFDIVPAPLTINATYDLKVYDGTTNVTDGTIPTVTGLQGSDTVTNLTESFQSRNVIGPGGLYGSTMVVNPDYVVNDGNGGNNYAITVNVGPGTIRPATLIIQANYDSKIYDGNTAISDGTVPSVSLLSNWPATGLIGSDTISNLTESFASPNAGSVQINVNPGWTINDGNGGNNYLVSNVLASNGNIEQAFLPVVVAPYFVTYDGTAHEASVQVNPNTDGLTSSSVDLSQTVHTDAGTYPDTAVINDPSNPQYDANYTTYSMVHTDYIVPATPTIVVSDSGGVYNGTPYTATATTNGDVTPVVYYETFNTDGTAESISTIAPVNVGHYAAWAMSDNSLNWNRGIGGQVSFDITPATATVNVSNYNVDYDGLSHSATGTVTGVNGPLPDSDLVINSTHTTAEVYANDSWSFADPNYLPQSGTVLDFIHKDYVTVTVTDTGGVYNGTPYAATTTVNGQPSLEGVTPTLTYWSESLYETQLSSAPTDAGNYRVSAFFPGSTDYYGDSSSTVYFTIAKANATGITVTPYNVTYDGSVHTATGVSPVGSLDLTQTEHTNAGTYTDTWVFHGGQDYNDQQGTVNDVINQTQISLVVTPYNVVYDGAVHSATGSATIVATVQEVRTVEEVVNGSIVETQVVDTIQVPENVGSLVFNSDHTNAGTYTDTWTFTDPGDNCAITGTMTDVITKATPTVTFAPVGIGSKYDGTQHGTEVIVTGANGTLLQDTVLTHVNAGAYTDKWTGYTDQTGNYNNVGGHSFTETITKVNAVINVTPYDVLYDGKAHKAVGTAVGVGGVALAGLNLANTSHVNVGKYSDTWTFTGGTNYNNASGTIVDGIYHYIQQAYQVPIVVQVPVTTYVTHNIQVPVTTNVREVVLVPTQYITWAWGREIVLTKFVQKVVYVPVTTMVTETVTVPVTQIVSETEYVTKYRPIKVYY